MEVKVGIQHVSREVVVETSKSGADIQQAFAEAVDSGGVFTVTDDRGRTVLLPAAKIAYVDLGEESARRVGFSVV